MNSTWLGRRWLPISVAALAAIGLLVVFLILRNPASSGADPTNTSSSSPSTVSGSPTPSLPVRETPVPPPTPGTIEETVKPAKSSATVSARLDVPAKLENGIEVSLIKIKATEIKAMGPGDTSGPAIAATVRIANGSKTKIDVDSAMVTLSYGKKGMVGTPSPADPASPFAGSIAAGDAAEGTYVFRVPAKAQDKVTVMVAYSAGVPVAKFDGAVR